MRNRRIGRLERKLRGIPLARTITGFAGFLALGVAAALYYGASYQSDALAGYVNGCPVESLSADINNTGLVECFIREHRDRILATASEYGVPPELIVATIKSENIGRQKLEDWKDEIGDFLGLDVSLGVGQVKVSTATSLERRFLGGTYGLDSVKGNLRNPDWNIDYIAMFYASEMKNLRIVDPDILLRDPRNLAELAARYVGGRKHGGEAGTAAFSTLLYLADTSTLTLFPRTGFNADDINRRIRGFVCSDGSRVAHEAGYVGAIDVTYLDGCRENGR